MFVFACVKNALFIICNLTLSYSGSNHELQRQGYYNLQLHNKLAGFKTKIFSTKYYVYYSL
jgi:hypothetical protein